MVMRKKWQGGKRTGGQTAFWLMLKISAQVGKIKLVIGDYQLPITNHQSPVTSSPRLCGEKV
jgi:hypothetical protein